MDPATLLARLDGLKALKRNVAWTDMLAPRISRAVTEHTSGVTNLSATKDARSEHLHAYHLAIELDKWLAIETERAEAAVRAMASPPARF